MSRQTVGFLSTMMGPRRRAATMRAFVAVLLLALQGQGRSTAGEVVHLINGSGKVAADTLNSSKTFVTSFQGTNDLTVTLLSGSMDPSYIDHFPPTSPTSNNPGYLSGFVGSASKGTGDGTAGSFNLLQETAGASLQFDFSVPLTSSDHFLVADVDNNERYTMSAYTLVGGVYVAVSLTGWTLDAYTGQMGTLPNSEWPTWDPTGGGPTTGTFTSNDDTNINEPLDVLTPNQPIDRIIFTETQGSGTPGLQFYASAVPEPSSLLTLALGIGGVLLARAGWRARARHPSLCPVIYMRSLA